MKTIVMVIAFLAASLSGSMQSMLRAETGWTTRVIKLGSDREISEATPILQRPNRPLHFYGNTVRRSYYRGNPMPTLEDVGNTFVYLLRR